ncbi:unnamed protein product [Albugo candida]|uniref:Alpha-taxilin n=1 Tax=Albugo candida TaxID=65357 RepID=A0A024GAP7_9STRA|nr:unnamed protein product [Albugo candida]|eukprot:CCI43754.1 unnamed protein product [Albugo candida]
MDVTNDPNSSKVNLGLKQQNEASCKKTLKHKHKSKRHQSSVEDMICASSRTSRKSHSHQPEDLRELLTSKIAQIEVGDQESLDIPIDLSGIYQDELLAQNTLDAFSNILRQLKNTDTDTNAQAEAEGRCNATHFDGFQNLTAKTTDYITAFQRKIGQIHSRKDLSSQFQKTIEEVGAKMDQQGKDYVTSLQENETLQQKLKSFLDQYTAREEHFQHQLEAKELTIQLAEAKLHRQIELTSQESQKTKLTLMKAKEFSDREVQLQMSKHIRKLEKENSTLRNKCAKYDQGAIASLQEQMETTDTTSKLHEKIKTLESLCRTLQAERNMARHKVEDQ